MTRGGAELGFVHKSCEESGGKTVDGGGHKAEGSGDPVRAAFCGARRIALRPEA